MSRMIVMYIRDDIGMRIKNPQCVPERFFRIIVVRYRLRDELSSCGKKRGRALLLNFGKLAYTTGNTRRYRKRRDVSIRLGPKDKRVPGTEKKGIA